jgi:hypothetical protein
MIRDLSVLWLTFGDGGVKGDRQRSRMMRVQPGVYEGVIPGQHPGTELHYELVLLDVLGSRVRSPEDPGEDYVLRVQPEDAGP